MIKMSEVAHMYKISRRNGHPETTKVLRGLLWVGLGAKQKTVMQLMFKHGTMRCTEVAGAMNIGRNNAGMLLRRLTDYGLLEHEEIKDSFGVHYRWTDVPDGRMDKNGRN